MLGATPYTYTIKIIHMRARYTRIGDAVETKLLKTNKRGIWEVPQSGSHFYSKSLKRNKGLILRD